MPQRPGGTQARRPLHFFWLLDTSASMGTGGKIDALNRAVRATLPALVETAAGNPFSELFVRVLAFSGGVHWHIAEPTPVEDVRWTDLNCHGPTQLGLALRTVADELTPQRMTARAFPPAIVLVSDGQPTDDFAGGLEALLASTWGRKAVRVAVAIGADADVDVLRRFVGDPDIPPLTAGNPDELVRHLRWVSTAATRIATQAAGGGSNATPSGVRIPRVPDPTDAADQVTW